MQPACNSAQLLTSAVNRDFRSISRTALHFGYMQAYMYFVCCCNRSYCGQWLSWQLCMPWSSSRVRKRKRRRWIILSAKAKADTMWVLWVNSKWSCFSIAFSVADAQEVLSEHESIDLVTDTVTVGGARCSVVDGFALLRSLSLEAGQTAANVCRYTMTVGSRTVDLLHLAFLVAWVSPGEAEGNRNILCGKVGSVLHLRRAD